MPKLSIVVPVYNVEKYLNQCIDSILGQSFTDFELIIVNDGSSDRSGSICDEYAQADQRVTVIHTENHGVVTARRTGVDCARGEYTAFVDSDDWVDADFYQCIFDEAGETNADVFICSRVNTGGICIETTSFHFGYYGKCELENIVFPRMMYDISSERYHIKPSLWDKVFRTKLIKEVYKSVDPVVTLGEDAVCTYPCIAQANSLFILKNDACYHYREDHVSMVNNCDVRLLQRVCALAVNMNRQFSELPKIFNNQVQHFIAYNGLYAANQVLLFNRQQRLCKRIQAVKEFFSSSMVAYSLQVSQCAECSFKLKLKLRLAAKKHTHLLWLLLKCNYILRKVKS